MNILFAMSLSGSIVFSFYLAAKPLSRRFFSAKGQYGMLKAAMLFYLLPYQHWKYTYNNTLEAMGLPFLHMDPNEIIYTFDLNKTMHYYEDGSVYYRHKNLIAGFFLFWFAIAFLIIFRHIVKYFICKRKLMMISDASVHGQDILRQCMDKLQMKTRQRISVFTHSGAASPFVMGIVKPVIMIPNTWTDNESYLKNKLLSCFIHELTHIRNHDILYKFIAFFIILLHWYNPLVYLLFRELCSISEIACDEAVTRFMTEEEKVSYARWVIEAALPKTDVSVLFADTFGRNNSILKRRIQLMLRNNHNKNKYAKPVAFLYGILIFITTPISVLAYQPPIHIGPELYTPADLDNSTSAFFTTDKSYLTPYTPLSYELDFTDCDEYFVDTDGNVTAIVPVEQAAAQSCVHTYVDGLYQAHRKSGAGCTITVYNGRQCTKCNDIILKDVYSEVKYTVCTHKTKVDN